MTMVRLAKSSLSIYLIFSNSRMTSVSCNMLIKKVTLENTLSTSPTPRKRPHRQVFIRLSKGMLALSCRMNSCTTKLSILKGSLCMACSKLTALRVATTWYLLQRASAANRMHQTSKIFKMANCKQRLDLDFPNLMMI